MHDGSVMLGERTSSGCSGILLGLAFQEPGLRETPGGVYHGFMASTLATVNSAASVSEAAEERASRLYEEDGYTWAVEQASALRSRDLAAIDWHNLIEEIEDLASSHRQSWESLCARAIQHLLQIQFWAERSPDALRGWAREIRNFRRQMANLIRKNPGLKGQYASMFAEAWLRGRQLAHGRLVDYELEASGLEGYRAAEKRFERLWDKSLPPDCPYTFDEVTAFDAGLDRQPRFGVWPPIVANLLDRLVQTHRETAE